MSVHQKPADWGIGHEIRTKGDIEGPAIVIHDAGRGPVQLVCAGEVYKDATGDVVPKRGRPVGTPHAFNIHNDPSVVGRLVCMLEELLERDDVRMDADTEWYWNKLLEIKKEITNGADAGGDQGTKEGMQET